ncbi:BTAD domain-containing putative transcriptional regulator [Actinomadura atramentaria]|uniref:BTAD domain-containing putative transcriptional regulator n=1 Tax=Actinomadura atramentaria TaxID=1990 RepID=UPI0003A9E6F0|nr:BTAD domain-containing putative transcriptional regulator [Actinomadura atramentaria]
MHYGVLGPVEVVDDGRDVPVGGPMVRALLALLALDAGRPVPVGRLVDGLYGEDPPDGAANALQSQVSRLRRGLGDARLVAGGAAGYRLAAEPDEVDALRFDGLARDGRRALAAGDGARAAELLGAAAGLWRGPALAGVAAPFAAGQAARLEEARLTALEDLAAARLLLGEAAGVVDGLRDLLAAHPLRERAVALLVRALAAAGRQAEALAEFEGVRARLADELGADPSPELAEAHLAVLRGERRTGRPERAPLPALLTSFVGRDEELAGIGAALAASRLITLLGPGGAGKTRLAVEAARRERGEACFVDLAPLGDGAEVPTAVLGALGLRENAILPGGRAAGTGVERLVAALAGRQMLLILDNCEHVVDAAADLTHRLLTACPLLRVLATSREPLGITGETLRPLPPLELPPAGADAATALEYPAVRLFRDRAAAVRPGFAVDGETVGDVVRICAALDGLPLAVELAAARLRSLPVREVAARLDDRFRLLSRGERTAAARHRTLRGVVEWSWDLLRPEERVAARRLTVFAGGFTLETAQEVCGLPEIDELVLELADKSLVQSDGARFRMLDTIRAFCEERLAEAGERAELERAHAAFFLGLARRTDGALRGAGQLAALDVLVAEHANLHAALRRSLGEPRTALPLVAALSWYWWLRGRVEGGALATELMAALGPDVPDGLEEEYVMCAANAVAAGGPVAWLDRAEEVMAGIDRPLGYPASMVLWALTAGPDRTDKEAFVRQLPDGDAWTEAVLMMSEGFLSQFRGDFAAGARLCEDALATFRAVGDRWGIANTLDPLSMFAEAAGDRERARDLLAEALAAAEELGALEDSADLLCRRAGLARRGGEAADAEADYRRAAALARRAGAPDKVSAAYDGLGVVARARGDLAAARHWYEEALAGLRSVERYLADAARMGALVGYGWVVAGEGDAARAAALFREALGISTDHPIFTARGGAVAGMAKVALLAGDAERAALLLGASTVPAGSVPPDEPEFRDVEAAVRAELGAERFAREWARGAALTTEEVVRTALE